MKIERIHVHRASLPVVGEPYRMSHTTVHELDSTLVEVVTDDGRHGWGETCPLGPVYQPHHALGARAALEQIGPGLIGAEIASPRGLARRMDELLAGHGYAKAALDTALLDLLGQELGVPVSTLLGGALVDRVPAYYSVTVGSPEDGARSAAAKVAEGYTRVQVKIGGRDLARDVETVHRVWEAVGHRARLAVDANRAMTVAHAVQFDRLTADVPFVLEQPCNTLGEMALLRGRLTHPVALDETTEDVDAVLRAISEGLADAFSFKVTRLGGPTRAAQARDLCALRSLPHTCDDAWGGAVVAAACIHLAATVEPRLLEGVWIAQDYIEGHYDPGRPVVVEDGYLEVPQEPGLGAAPDRTLLTPVATYG
ncbi:mandelate racemase/muconate lactonizing enzyme family protein [Actinomycetospora sp. TBRC 11914]|uniref:mandelate racemase/muconate lactonizing enzyme family protein n=1 Tax=Actinomycetospora sp. TBRC 11914 TaxID=2729387 RepID=UPI00145E4CBF|nr:mandelate racemase/muconate lactonizing enzyme family protein [Actinomycetospora sp. TBRC 11914]NMO90879.1 mandelate racemase/muconate lactonizing enzyme family protein [Actinomycetospora sp. TBRC 11914]